MTHHNNSESYTTDFNRTYKTTEPSYYERIPAILDHVTFISSEIDSQGLLRWYRKRLSPTTKEVYRAIKNRAGKQNKCWKTLEHIAEQVGCSKKSVIKAKKELSESFEQLQGTSLINVDIKRVKTFDDQGTALNTRETHTISIEHIWGYNDEYMKTHGHEYTPMSQEITEREALIAIEKMRQPTMDDYAHNPEAECKKEPSRGSRVQKETPLPGGQSAKVHSKQTTLTDPSALEADYTADAASASHINENLFEAFDDEGSAAKHLRQMGCDKSFTHWIIENFSLGDVLQAILYLSDCQKKKRIPNPQAYLRKILNGGWYRKTRC